LKVYLNSSLIFQRATSEILARNSKAKSRKSALSVARQLMFDATTPIFVSELDENNSHRLERASKNREFWQFSN
jgi:hypothetical protein